MRKKRIALIVVLLFLIALSVYIATHCACTPTMPIWLYWVFVVIGVLAYIAGITLIFHSSKRSKT